MGLDQFFCIVFVFFLFFFWGGLVKDITKFLKSTQNSEQSFDATRPIFYYFSCEQIFFWGYKNQKREWIRKNENPNSKQFLRIFCQFKNQTEYFLTILFKSLYPFSDL
jgi:hypothetical protein